MAIQGAIFSRINLRIGQSSPDGTPPELKPIFDEVYNAFSQLVQTLDTYCGVTGKAPLTYSVQDFRSTILSANLNRFYAQATENIVYGGLVSVDGTTAAEKLVRNANATDATRPCIGYCNTPGGVTVGSWGEFILRSGLCPIAGLTIGQQIWLGTTNGLATNVRPVAAGNIEQFVGIALATDILFFNCAGYVQH